MSWCQLTQWGRVMYICISKLTIIGSDNDFSSSWRQAIIWTNAWILLIRILGANLNEVLSKIYTFSFKKMHLKMLSGKCQPFCLSLNVLSNTEEYWYMSPRNPWKSLSTYYILRLLISLQSLSNVCKCSCNIMVDMLTIAFSPIHMYMCVNLYA